MRNPDTRKADSAHPERAPLEGPARLWTASVPCLAAAGFYTAIAALIFRSAWQQLQTHLIGDGGDCFEFYWNAWWIDHSLLSGRNPYWCDVQLIPGVSLALHTLSLIPSTLIALLGHVLTLPAAYNLMVIGLYPTAGLCLFALARSITRDTAGALAGGLAFMMCPFLASKSVGHLNLQCAALLPLFTLCLLRSLRDTGRRRPWATAAVFTLILFSSIHTAIFAGNVVLWAYLFCAIRERQWRTWLLRFRTALAPTLIVGGLWGAFLLYAVVRYRLEPHPYRALFWCPEPLSYVLPLHSTSWWRGRVSSARPLWNLELAVYLGWLVLPMALCGWYAARRQVDVRLMVVLFAAALVLSIGHKLQWNREIVTLGGVPIRLPMGIYRYVPVLGAVGQSGRYLVIGYMAIGVGVAAAISAVRHRWGTGAARAGALAAAGLICIDYGFVPVYVKLPACPIPPGSGIVMDPRLGEPRALYYQTVHGRPLLGGYIARIPLWLYASYRSDAELGWFFEPPDRRGGPPAAASIVPALQRRKIEYVCVAAGSAEQALLEESGLTPMDGEAGDVFYRVPTPAGRPLPEWPERPRSGPS